MVWLLFLRFATSLTHHDRALDTVHEALTIAGGQYSTCTALRPLVLVHITYPHSLQIRRGWPDKPIINVEGDPVSHFLRHNIPHALISLPSELVVSSVFVVFGRSHQQGLVTVCLYGTHLFLFLERVLISFRPWVQ